MQYTQPCSVLLASIVTLAALPVAAGGLPDGKPRAIYPGENGAFLLHYGHRVFAYKDGVERVIDLKAPKGASLTDPLVAVSPIDHTVWAAVSSTSVQILPPGTVQHVWLVECRASCDFRLIFEADSTGDHTETLTTDHLVVDREGKPFLFATHVVTVTTKDSDGDDEQRTTSDSRTYRASGEFAGTTLPTGEQMVFDHQNHLVAASLLFDEIAVSRAAPDKGTQEVRLGPARYHFGLVAPETGGVLVFYHDSGSASFMLARLGDEQFAGGKVQPEVLDGEESGIENVALADANGWTAVAYFYRNVFYKGLKIFREQSGQRTSRDLTTARDRNVGWELAGALGTDGSVLMAYLDNVLDDKHTTRSFASVDAMMAAGAEPPTGWEVAPQKVFVLAGAGGMYNRWGLVSMTPSADDVPAASRYDVTYTLADTVSTEALIEGKIGTTKIGATYLHSLVSRELKSAAGKSASRAFDFATLVLGWDKLFLNNDVQLKLEWGQLQGLMAVKDQPQNSREVATERRGLEVALLNAYRIKAGLSYTNMSLPMPVYAWGIAPGEKSWTFLTSALARTSYHDLAIFGGYSMLDYTAKYEVTVARPYLDLVAGFGMSIARLDHRLAVPAPYDSVRTSILPYVAGTIEVGYLVQTRSYRLHGLGGFARAGLRARGTFTLGGGKPGDKDEKATSHDSTLTISRGEGSWGPYATLGLVF